MKRTTALISALLSVSSLFLMPAQSTWAATDSPATKVALHGNQAIAAKHGSLISHKNAADVVSVTLTLNLRNQDQLNAFLADLYNPTSPDYKKFLTPHQFAEKFGPTAADVQTVTAFATANGLKVTRVAAGNQSVTVSGTVSDLERAFGVKINNYHNVKGQTYFANATTPTVPFEVASVIKGVVGLDNEPKQREHAIRMNGSKAGLKQSSISPNQTNFSDPIGGYSPSDLRSAYDITPLTNAGFDGTGQKIALVEFDGYNLSNIATFDSYYGLGSPGPTTVSVDGYSGAATPNGEDEVELDIEVLNAIAPKAQVMVYEAPNLDQAMLDMYQRIANDDTANTVSISWGMCEADAPTSLMDSLDNILAQMAAQGQSVFAASGDSGAYDCGDGVTLSVDSPSNDPNVTGVGGTSLYDYSDTNRDEIAWSDSSSNSGGGGGLSEYYSQPSWQTGPGVEHNGQRQVPDVSADADPATGYSIYTGGQWSVYGGTSAATPLWAGIAALNDQYAANLQKPNLGKANQVLYQLFNSTQTYPAYHDVTTGDNLYYSAGTGYDLTTGMGTPDAYNLIRDINDGASTGTTLSITANAATLASGQSEAVKVMSVTGAGKPVDVTTKATWTSSAPTVASVRSGVLYANGAGTATLTAKYNNATATFVITVTPKLTGLSLGTKTMSMQVGDTKQLSATATYSDGSSADVTSQVNWSSSNASLLSVDSNGVLSAYKKGSVTVTGRYQGQTVTLSVAVTPVLQTITVTPNSSTVTIGGTPLVLSVKAIYNDGSTANVSRLATITSEFGLVTIHNGMIYGATKGNDFLDVSYNGQTAQVAVTVVPQLKSLQVTPVTNPIQVGTTQQLAVTAVFNDGSTADVTTQINWVSSNKSVAGIDANGLVTALKRGTATLSGLYQSHSVKVNVSVVPVLTQITATVPQTLAVGRSAAVSVLAIYNDGSKISVGTLATLTSANGDFTVRGSVIIGKTAGQDTVTVTYGGQTVSVPITITAH